MLLVRGSAGGTTLTGTLYEPDEQPPRFRGAPEEDAPYVWVCDEFYEVESGGALQRIDGREVRVAFETPMPRGFDTREQALAAAREHLRTQFARIGLDAAAVEIDVREAADDPGRSDGAAAEPPSDDDGLPPDEGEPTDDRPSDSGGPRGGRE